MNDDRHEDNEAREDSAVAEVVAAEKVVEEDACDGVGDAARG